MCRPRFQTTYSHADLFCFLTNLVESIFPIWCVTYVLLTMALNMPSLRHQRPTALLKTCIIVYISKSPTTLTFPCDLPSFVQKVKDFIDSIPEHTPFLSSLLTIPCPITDAISLHDSPSHQFTLNQVINASSPQDLISCTKQILHEIELISIPNTTTSKLLHLSTVSSTSSTTLSLPSLHDPTSPSSPSSTVIVYCNIDALRYHFRSLLHSLNSNLNGNGNGSAPKKKGLVIPKKRTWHELHDSDLLYSSNFAYPLSKIARVEIDDTNHNNNILQRVKLAQSIATEVATKSIKDVQEEVSDLLDYKSYQKMNALDASSEVIDLLRTPTTRDILINNLYSTKGDRAVFEFCDHGTKQQCALKQREEERRGNMMAMQRNGNQGTCDKIHFIRIMRPHTTPNLGDCSYLDGCRHMDTCRFVHYIVDEAAVSKRRPYFRCRKFVNKLIGNGTKLHSNRPDQGDESDSSVDTAILDEQIYQNPAIHRYEAQWINCDVRALEFGVLCKYGVIMADPPWDIHMELPYGTLTDDEMLNLPVGQLADDNCLLFLWVTGRVMETARRCMNRWGFECREEVLWIKTNQLQRIIRTGRTGHWLNHSKEHCLVGVKGNDIRWNRGLDCDVIVAEVRETSRKPDEIYNVIERLSPGTEKIEIFGRPHNARPGWMTLGNQLDGTRILDPKIVERFRSCYPTINIKTTAEEEEEGGDDGEEGDGHVMEQGDEQKDDSTSGSGTGDKEESDDSSGSESDSRSSSSGSGSSYTGSYSDSEYSDSESSEESEPRKRSRDKRRYQKRQKRRRRK